MLLNKRVSCAVILAIFLSCWAWVLPVPLFIVIPNIIHSIHFQWDENQYVDPLGAAFDMTPHHTMCAYAPDFDVRLWTYPLSRDFCVKHYPAIWEILQTCSRPVMMIDVLRWLITYHFGGIYWQMRTIPLVPMSRFFPTPGQEVRLFTENVMTPTQCQAMAIEPIREGRPEEPIRVSNQVFSAASGHPFLQDMVSFLLGRIQTMTPRKDYDVLYISANGAVSEAYDTFGKQAGGIELTNLETTRRMVKWRYGGAWRKDKTRTDATSAFSPARPPLSRTDRMPFVMRHLYKFVKPHAHETEFAETRRSMPHSRLVHLQSFIREKGIQRVCEMPSGRFTALPDAFGTISYFGLDVDRRVVRANQHEFVGTGRKFSHIVPLYARYPHVDLLICGDFLEYLSFAEGIRVLRRMLKTARPKYLALTNCPLLLDFWDTALGDFRPINFQRKPYAFPEPIVQIPLPPRNDRRADYSLAVWETRSLPPLG